ncbi:MAG TPA: acetoacetate decarboxylase family protein [Aldersonia sp.]
MSTTLGSAASFFDVPTTPTTTTAGDVDLPIKYYDGTAVIATFIGDPDGVNAALDGTGLTPALHVGRRPVVAIGLFDYRHTEIGAYREVGLAIPVVPHARRFGIAGWLQLYRRPTSRADGMYVVDLPVTTQIACTAGIEIWGFPKFVTEIAVDLGNGHLEANVDDPGGTNIMRLTGPARRVLPTPPLHLVTYCDGTGRVVCANIEVRNAMRTHAPANVRLTIGPSTHRMAENLRSLGLDGARPFLVVSTTRFQSLLNAPLS